MSVSESISFDKEGNPESGGPRRLIRKLFLSLLIALVAVISFGLGQLSGGGESEPIRLEYAPLDAPKASQAAATVLGAGKSAPAAPAQGSQVVASSHGKRYYYPSCSGAGRISAANLITFASPREAEAAGYTLANSCRP